MRVLIISCLLFVASMAQTEIAVKQCDDCRCDTAGETGTSNGFDDCLAAASAAGAGFFTWRSSDKCQIPAADENCSEDNRVTDTSRAWAIYKIETSSSPQDVTEAPEATEGAVCSSNSDCGDGFCNFDGVTTGSCESCDSISDCTAESFDTTQGSASCVEVCEAFQNIDAVFTNTDSSYSMDGGLLEMFANTPCSLIESACESATANEPCQYSYCRQSDDRCFVQAYEIDHKCTTEKQNALGETSSIPGVCIDGQCVWNDSAECPDGLLTAERTFPSCGNQNFHVTYRFQEEKCPQTGSNCDDFGPTVSNLICWTSSTKNDPSSPGKFDVHFHDPNDVSTSRDGHGHGKCIIGEETDCVMGQSGFYQYRGMDISWSTGENANEYTTTLTIPLTQKILSPYLHCEPDQWCRGTITCSMIAMQPCGRTSITCDGTEGPTQEPTIPASHGDPIIWTFNGDCYDLHQDGIYLASSHAAIDHDVHIAVYNDYMREIQITDKSGDILLSVNNLGDVINNWPYRFTEETKKCPIGEDLTCNLFYKEYTFDAQQFRFVVQILPHDYLDPALKEGEQGIHLDIFPRPYSGFSEQKNNYTGLYFSNPLPEELEYCPEGSQRHR